MLDQHPPQPPVTLIDFGEALRKVGAMKRCLPAAGIHWIEPGNQHCQCGKTKTLRRPPDRQNV